MATLLEAIGLPDTPENKIYAGAALKWLSVNTTCEFDLSKSEIPEDVQLEDVQLFVLKYSQLMTNHAGVASESISGLSQSFVTGQNLENSIYGLAVAIFGLGAIKSNVTVFSGEDRWEYGC